MCHCMPVEMVSFISGLLRHMLSVVQGTSCDIVMKHPSFLQDKKPTPPPLPLPRFLYCTFVIGGAIMKSIQW